MYLKLYPANSQLHQSLTYWLQSLQEEEKKATAKVLALSAKDKKLNGEADEMGLAISSDLQVTKLSLCMPDVSRNKAKPKLSVCVSEFTFDPSSRCVLT